MIKVLEATETRLDEREWKGGLETITSSVQTKKDSIGENAVAGAVDTKKPTTVMDSPGEDGGAVDLDESDLKQFTNAQY